VGADETNEEKLPAPVIREIERALRKQYRGNAVISCQSSVVSLEAAADRRSAERMSQAWRGSY
jgi:hypothetical protein